MAMDIPARLPLNDNRRVIERDRKLLFREELLADLQRQVKRVCKCNNCLGENHSLRLRTIVSQHLSIYGRHPYHRGSTQVRFLDSPMLLFVMTRMTNVRILVLFNLFPVNH